MTPADRIPIADLLRAVAKEIKAAHALAGDKPVMQFQECELEFAMEVEKGANGGIEFWLVKLGGDVKKSDRHTIKVRYQANPQNPMGALAEVAIDDILPPSPGD